AQSTTGGSSASTSSHRLRSGDEVGAGTPTGSYGPSPPRRQEPRREGADVTVVPVLHLPMPAAAASAAAIAVVRDAAVPYRDSTCDLQTVQSQPPSGSGSTLRCNCSPSSSSIVAAQTQSSTSTQLSIIRFPHSGRAGYTSTRIIGSLPRK